MIDENDTGTDTLREETADAAPEVAEHDLDARVRVTLEHVGGDARRVTVAWRDEP